MKAKKKTIAEQELTTEQLDWIKDNRDHPKVSHLMVQISMLNSEAQTTGSLTTGLMRMPDAESLDCIRKAMRDFKQWWEKIEGE